MTSSISFENSLRVRILVLPHLGEGRKSLKEWLGKTPSNNHKPLWLTIPRSNSKKAAEQLIKSLEVEQLREIHTLIEESLSKE